MTDNFSAGKICRVAIIGGGPAGVCAAKQLQRHAQFKQIDIYEQQSSFGGVWNLHPDGKKESSVATSDPEPLAQSHEDGSIQQSPVLSNAMYEGLETNIPNLIMKHSDDSSLEELQLFPRREQVLDYLCAYAAPVQSLTLFGTKVVDARFSHQASGGKWIVKSLNLLTKESLERRYDGICVAAGHYNVPFVPQISGMKQWNEAFPNRIRHSKEYLNPRVYMDQKVIIVGNSASGTDICSQLASTATLPILVSSRNESPLSYSADYKKPVSQIVDFLDPQKYNRAVRFKDGSIETDVDAVIFCTGYDYSFPFLSSLNSPPSSTGERVENLYEHVFYQQNPTLCFLGLPFHIVPFRTLEGQAAIIALVWTGKLELPSMEMMQSWEKDEIALRGDGRYFHRLLYPQDFNYHNRIMDWVKTKSTAPDLDCVPPNWTKEEYWYRERLAVLKQAFVAAGEARFNIQTPRDLGFVPAVSTVV